MSSRHTLCKKAFTALISTCTADKDKQIPENKRSTQFFLLAVCFPSALQNLPFVHLEQGAAIALCTSLPQAGLLLTVERRFISESTSSHALLE